MNVTTVSTVQCALCRITCILTKVLSAGSILVSRRRNHEIHRDIDIAVVFDFWATISEYDLPLLRFGSMV